MMGMVIPSSTPNENRIEVDLKLKIRVLRCFDLILRHIGCLKCKIKGVGEVYFLFQGFHFYFQTCPIPTFILRTLFFLNRIACRTITNQ